jgi:hypothetical protein
MVLLAGLLAHAAAAQAPDEFDPVTTSEPPEEELRKIHVSTSTGNDNNTGRTPVAPVQTLARAVQLLRDGHPDQVLLKRGDTWREPLGEWTRSGAGPDAPMVIGAYGEQGPRPQILTPADAPALSKPADLAVKHLVVRGIAMYSHTRDPKNPAFRRTDHKPAGIDWPGAGTDVLIQDCLVRGYAVGISVRGTREAPVKGLRLERCIVTDCYGPPGESYGVLAEHVAGLTLQQCVLDLNGWHPTVGAGDGRERSLRNANLLATGGTTDVLVEDCLLSRASGAALDLAPGGVVRNNVFYANPVGVAAGLPLARPEAPPGKMAALEVRENVMLHHPDATDGVGGRGVVVSNVRTAEVVNNVFSRSVARSVDEGMALHVMGPRKPRQAGAHNVTFHFNTVYDWPGYRLQPTYSLARDLQNVSIRDNLVQSPGRDSVLARLDHGYVAEFGFARNVYHSRRPQAGWFRARNAYVSLPAWLRGAHESVGLAEQVEFEAPGRDLAAFSAHRGGPGTIRGYIDTLRERQPGTWDEDMAPQAAVEWIRQGFAPKQEPSNPRAGAVPGQQN